MKMRKHKSAISNQQSAISSPPTQPSPSRGEGEGEGWNRISSARFQSLRNEEGIAMAMVLVISVILLAIMLALIYMLVSGTKISGIQKRYDTAYEAGMGGADFAYQFIAAQADPGIPGLIYSFTPNMLNTCMSGIGNKLSNATANWNSACNSSMTINPADNTTYDMTVNLGQAPNPTYTVYAKIVDTVPGNSGRALGLSTGGVVNSGQLKTVSIPYLYTIEIDSENSNNPAERAKLSVLYEY